jgi:quercetin dioxygenase-like cupin family protein
MQLSGRQALKLLGATAVATPQHTGRRTTVEIRPKQPSMKGPAEWFTGDVWIDPIASGQEPSRIRVSAVRFTPGARTAWHSHAVGQTLYVTEGAGLVQSRGGDLVDIRSGDIVYTPPDEWHWHGAAPDHFMTHLSMTEGVAEGQGPESEWGDHVTDDEYSAR